MSKYLPIITHDDYTMQNTYVDLKMIKGNVPALMS